MAKRYYSKVSTWIALSVWVTIILSAALCFPIFFSGGSFAMRVSVFLVLAATIFLLLSVFFNTYYSIKNGFLHWVTGPFKGKIEIASIRELTRPKSMMELSGMMKPVLSSKPLLVKYNKYDDMPFSPLDEKEFIAELKRENAEIEILNIEVQPG